jgi:hypothetical protein
MSTIFSETLTKFRNEAGFQTAYSFFHSVGGQPVLKASYRMYLLFEQGKKLPPFKNLGLYIHALRLYPRSRSAMEFITAWLKVTLGEDDFRHMLEPFLAVPQKESLPSPFHKAIKKSLNQKKVYITPEQMAVIMNDYDTYVCWVTLDNDTGRWSGKTLATETGISVSSADKAIRRLAAVKLIKRQKDGTYKCPTAGAPMEYPFNIIPNGSELQRKFAVFRAKLIESGNLIYRRCGILRASFTELSNCFPLLSLNISTAATYAITKKEKDSALFALECKVTKIRDF